VAQTSRRCQLYWWIQRGKFRGADLGVVVGAGIGPFPKSGLDEAFGFAISARTVGASEALAQVELTAEATKDSGAIAGTVIGENTADGDAELGIVIDRSLEKGGLARKLWTGWRQIRWTLEPTPRSKRGLAEGKALTVERGKLRRRENAMRPGGPPVSGSVHGAASAVRFHNFSCSAS
jgi:hypothetical protein